MNQSIVHLLARAAVAATIKLNDDVIVVVVSCRRRRRHSLFVLFNNLIILQYNTFIWLVFSIGVLVYVVELTKNGNQFSEMNQVFLYVLIDGKLPLFTFDYIYTYL